MTGKIQASRARAEVSILLIAVLIGKNAKTNTTTFIIWNSMSPLVSEEIRNLITS